MYNYTEHLVLHLTKLEKEYIEEYAERTCLSTEQFLVLCAISLGYITNEKLSKSNKKD